MSKLAGLLTEEKKSVKVTVEVSGDNCELFKAFMEAVAHLCNEGCSRDLGILDGDGDEKDIKWSFDGDGTTRIKVK